MPAVIERFRSIFKLDATKPMAEQYADQRQQALAAWRDAVAAGADGRPVSLLELQQAALAIGIVPTRLAAAFEGDVADWRAERELQADAARAEKLDAETTIIAERAQAEVAQIEAKWQELRRLAASAYGSGVAAGQARSACDRHRNQHPRLWDDAHRNDPVAAAAALEVPAADTPPAIIKPRSNSDDGFWITDDDK
jgi:hypothetical protein